MQTWGGFPIGKKTGSPPQGQPYRRTGRKAQKYEIKRLSLQNLSKKKNVKQITAKTGPLRKDEAVVREQDGDPRLARIKRPRSTDTTN